MPWNFQPSWNPLKAKHIFGYCGGSVNLFSIMNLLDYLFTLSG